MKRKNDFLYLKLANIIREQISSKILKPGDFLMSENDLGQRYGLSRISVRKSLNKLVEEGLLVKKAGLGSVVATDYSSNENKRKILRIVTTSPSNYVDFALGLIIETFEIEFPNAEVKLIHTSANNFWESIHSLQVNGLPPDLIFVTDRQYRELQDHAGFTDLNDRIEYTKKLFYPKLLRNFRDKSALKALPITFSPVFLAYNPEMFHRHGIPTPHSNWSLAAMMETAEKLTMDTNGDGIIDQFGLSLSPTYTRWPVIAMQHMVTFNKLSDHVEELRSALSFVHDLIYRKRIAILHIRNRNSRNIEPFVTQNAAMMLTTMMELGAWKDEVLPFEPEIAPLVFGIGQSTLLVANAIMIPDSCPDHELAVAFCKIAVRSDVQEKVSRATQFLSVLKTVNEKIWDKPYLSSINIADSRLENCYFIHEVFPSMSFINEMDFEMGLFWAGLETVDSVIERLVRIPSNLV
ncbi:MAG: GntR family transcriptional regulator [Paenibacillus sp.]|jgi:multiple sugar transport system substrate-binding protein|nr:GntR family transcriptional regulator [Paenibacillus sp.]